MSDDFPNLKTVTDVCQDYLDARSDIESEHSSDLVASGRAMRRLRQHLMRQFGVTLNPSTMEEYDDEV